MAVLWAKARSSDCTGWFDSSKCTTQAAGFSQPRLITGPGTSCVAVYDDCCWASGQLSQGHNVFCLTHLLTLIYYISCFEKTLCAMSWRGLRRSMLVRNRAGAGVV